MLQHLSPTAIHHISWRNELKQSTAALLGMAQGVLADQLLTDSEIQFLEKWLSTNKVVSADWPGSILYAHVTEILLDGKVTEEERAHLVDLLKAIIGDQMEEVPEAAPVIQLPMDKVQHIHFEGQTFCFTGEFVMGPRSVCSAMTSKRGGIPTEHATRELNYLIVGSLGSKQWKNNSFGTKIDAIVKHKMSGKASTQIISEDHWANALSGNGATGV